MDECLLIYIYIQYLRLNLLKSAILYLVDSLRQGYKSNLGNILNSYRAELHLGHNSQW